MEKKELIKLSSATVEILFSVRFWPCGP